MLKRKVLALLIVGLLILQMIPIELFAVTNIRPTVIVTNEGEKSERSPSIYINWKEVGFNPFPNPNLTPGYIQGSDQFKIEMTDVTKGNSTSPLIHRHYKEKGEYDTTLNNNSSFEGITGEIKGLNDGKIYKLNTTPYYLVKQEDKIVEVKVDESHTNVYFITDFNTQIESGEDGITVIWEDISSSSAVTGLTYEIGWREGGSYRTENDMNGQGLGLLKTKVLKKEDLIQISGNKVKYTIEDTLPGYIYSVYVKVKATDGKQPVIWNRKTGLDGPKVVRGTSPIKMTLNEIGADKDFIEIAWYTRGRNYKNTEQIMIQTSLSGEEDGDWKDLKPMDLEDSEGYKDIPQSIIIRAPKEPIYFRVRFRDRDSRVEVFTNIERYIPFELRVEPVKPKIPKPYNKNIKLTSDTGEKKDDYLVTEDSREWNLDSIDRFLEATFHAKPGKGIQLVWDAPKEDKTGLIEYSMNYDIYVSDDKTTINSIKDPKQAIVNIVEGDIEEGDEEHIVYTEKTNLPVGFKWSLTDYMDATGKIKPIIPNKTYYIKIVAKRPYGGSVFAESQPTIVGITLDKNGEIFIPPVLGKPPLKLNEVTTTTAELKWREEWYEILAKNLDQYTDPDERFLAGVGSARVYTTVTTTGAAIRFSAQEGANEHILLQEKNVDEVVQKVGGRASFDENYIDRYIKLGADVQYEFNMLTYSEAVKQMEGTGLKIEEWVQTEGNNLQGWEEIKPELKKEELGLDWRFHKVENLKPNTKYLMMVRAYRMVDGEKQMQTFPSYIICTTLTDYEGPEPTPIVPQLHLKSKTDTSLSVWFKYNKDFTYEIVYSRTDDPDKAKVWPFEISDDPTNPNYVANGAERVVTINGLFPETTYNVWIRAKQKKGDKVSAWSTPVRAKTDSVKAPDAPTGLGPAAYQSILDLGLDFQGVGSDYITVEWMKNPNDKGKQTEGSMEKEYTYILEFADNVEFLDSILVETTDDGKGESGKNVEVLSKTMVKFTGLQPNRPYYVRVKTKLIFKDTESKKEIVKESEFCKWVRINTKTGNGDYDDGDNENIVIYPDKVEESYKDNIWTWEILDTQRIISEILTKNAYFFTIDMQLYRDKQDAIIRRIKMPKAVLDALINKNMEIKVLTQIGTYELPARSIAYYSSKGSAKDMIQFDFKTVLPYDIKELSKPYPYTIQKAEAFTISLKGATAVNTPLSRLDGEVKVSHKLEASTQYLYKNLQSHTYDYTLGKWVKENATVSSAEGGISHINYATPRLGIYALYNVESYADTTYTNPAMNQLLTRYEIKGLGTAYRASTVVNSDQFILLMLGIAQDQPEIDLTTPLTSSLRKKAETSGIYIESNNRNLTQEMAVSGVVKLYEMKEGRKIKASKVMGSAASAKYQENIAKAMTLGLIQNINPTAPITYGELCTLIVQVLP